MNAPLKAILLIGAVLAVAACEDKLASTPDISDPNDPVVARVNGEPIRESEVTSFYEALPPDFRQIPQALVQEQLIERLVERKLVAAAAVEAGVQETDAFKKRMAEQRENVLQEIYLNEAIEDRMTEDRIATAYDAIVADFEPSPEIKARHILVDTEEEAVAVIAELDAGADFAELAAEKSIGPSAERGGDLGYFTDGTMVEPFSNAAFAMQPGSYSKEPVQTEFGYHVILVEESRDSSPAPLEEVEPEIRRRETGTIYSEIIADLRKDAEIEIGNGEAAPSMPPALEEAPMQSEEEAGTETGAP